MSQNTYVMSASESVARASAKSFFVDSKVATGNITVITQSGSRHTFTVREGYEDQIQLTPGLCHVRSAWAQRNGCYLPQVTRVAYYESAGSFVLLDDDLREIRATSSVRDILVRNIATTRP